MSEGCNIYNASCSVDFSESNEGSHDRVTRHILIFKKKITVITVINSDLVFIW